MEDLCDSLLTAFDTVRYANASVAATSESKTGDLSTSALNLFNTTEMSDCVLRHAEVPSEDP